MQVLYQLALKGGRAMRRLTCSRTNSNRATGIDQTTILSHVIFLHSLGSLHLCVPFDCSLDLASRGTVEGES